MASMFNICAIATDWRIIVNPNSGMAVISAPNFLAKVLYSMSG